MVIRRLHHECPDNHLAEWERLPLVSLEAFSKAAHSLSALQAWAIENADWREVYRHFVTEADKQIDAHNESVDRQPGEDLAVYLQRMVREVNQVTTEDRWSGYEVCYTCGVGASIQCVNKRSGEPAKNPHPGRRKSKLPAAEQPVEATTEDPVATTPAKRRQRPAVDSNVQSHNLNVVSEVVAGHDTFRAICSCRMWSSSNITSRSLVVQEHQDHVAAMMVSA